MLPLAFSQTVNLLPCDGSAYYHGEILSALESERFFDALLHEIEWAPDEVVLFGRRITTARKVAWHGDAPFAYTYSGGTKEARPWTPALKELKKRVEQCSGATFNSCLMNFYHHGGEGMAWHSDDEKMLVRHAPIASLSLGAERRFLFKHRSSGEKVSLSLENGSLLVMRDEIQSHWLHSLPKTTKVTSPRVNLTFRSFALTDR